MKITGKSGTEYYVMWDQYAHTYVVPLIHIEKTSVYRKMFTRHTRTDYIQVKNGRMVYGDEYMIHPKASAYNMNCEQTAPIFQKAVDTYETYNGINPVCLEAWSL